MKILFKAQRTDTKDWIYGDLIANAASPFKFIRYEVGLKFDDIERGVFIKVLPASVCQYTGLDDKNEDKIFSDDLLKDEKGTIFRIYQVRGGFVVKASVWSTDTKDWVDSDELISAPLSDPQMISYIRESCWVIGNANDEKE